MGTILVLSVLAVTVGLILRGMYRDKKQGKTCGGCPGCSSCAGCRTLGQCASAERNHERQDP